MFVFGNCFVMQELVSFLILRSLYISAEEAGAGCFTLIICLLYRGCPCFLALPGGAVGGSNMCDCGISWSY